MRKSVLCLSVALSVWTIWGQTVLFERKLPDFVAPAQEHKPDNPVWDLSAAEMTAVPEARCDCYGDTLLSEIMDGYRLWYRLETDSVFFIGEEARLMYMIPDSRLTAVMPGTAYSAVDTEYECQGLYSRMFPVGERGSFRSFDLGSGVLVIAPGDTVCARMICEERVFTALPEDTTAQSMRHETRRLRWYDTDGSRMPLAVGLECVTRDVDGHQIDAVSVAYVVDERSFLDKKRREKEQDSSAAGRERIEAVSHALADASVEFRDGCVRVNVTSRTEVPFDLTVDITDNGGILFRHESAAVDGSCNLEISTAGMPAHAYIVILTAEGITEKRMLAIW